MDVILCGTMQAMPIYFATNNVGQLIHVSTVSKPEMTEEDVAHWVVEAVETAYSFDYLNYHSQLQGAQKYFTSFGWSKYIAALATITLMASRIEDGLGLQSSDVGATDKGVLKPVSMLGNSN